MNPYTDAPTMIRMSDWTPPPRSQDKWPLELDLEEAGIYESKSGKKCLRMRFEAKDQTIWHLMPIEGRDKNNRLHVQQLGEMILSFVGSSGQLKPVEASAHEIVNSLLAMKKFRAWVRWDTFRGREHLRIVGWVPRSCYYGPPSTWKDEDRPVLYRIHNEATSRTDFIDAEGAVLAAAVAPELAQQFEEALERYYGDIDWQTRFADSPPPIYHPDEFVFKPAKTLKYREQTREELWESQQEETE